MPQAMVHFRMNEDLKRGMEEIMIDVQHMSFSYPGDDRDILSDISLSISRGDVITLLGPNGTGKSTFMKCIAGLLSPHTGRIFLQSIDIATLSPHQIAQSIAYVPQIQTPSFPYSVLEIVMMGRAAHLGLFSEPKKEDELIAQDALEMVGMSHLVDRPCTKVSGGEWQLIMIARAIAQGSEIFLFDEPTSHLDLGNQVRVLEVISKLRATGKTILIATHVPDHAFLLATKVAMMQGTGIRAYGVPDAVLRENIMSDVYGVSVSLIDVGDRNTKICLPLCNLEHEKEHNS